MVPAIWRLEVVNALLMMRRRGRIELDGVATALRALSELPIALDDETWPRAWTDVASLAAAHRLTAYDAAYLELATRRRLPLATLDSALRRAATAQGLTLV